VRQADNQPPSSADVKKSGSLNLPEPSGPHRPVMGMLYFYLHLGGTEVYFSAVFPTNAARGSAWPIYFHASTLYSCDGKDLDQTSYK
jgi:hypothetical protein